MAKPNADKLLALEVLDREGSARPLSEVVAGGPALLVFLRHFG